jgi:hypothetical protein
MYYELKKIDLWSAIKISFMINAIIGLVIGFFIGLVFTFLIGIVGHMVPSDTSDFGALPFGAMGGFMIGIIYALMIAILNGVVLTGIAVVLYNLFSGWLGGIKVDFQSDESPEIRPIMPAASGQAPPSTAQDGNV